METISGTIYDMIGRHAKERPNATAIQSPGGRSLTYWELFTEVDRKAEQLGRFGIESHDRVATILHDGAQAAVTLLSVVCAAQCAPLNPEYREEELRFFLSDIEPKAMIVEKDRVSRAQAVAKQMNLKLIEMSPAGSEKAGIFVLEGKQNGTPDTFSRRVDMPATGHSALFLHTSGTTSRPKLVPLSHRNLLTSANNLRDSLCLNPNDRALSIMPLFHIHGLVAGVLASLNSGGTVICIGKFDATAAARCITQDSPTWYSAVPTVHAAILKTFEERKHRPGPDLHLRFIRSSSAPLPPTLMKKLESYLKVPVIESYGMTEAAHQICSNPLPPGERKAGSVGRAAGPQVAIVGEDGQFVESEKEGEIVIQGPNITAGYYNNEEANAQAFHQGWFRTGDLGRLDADCYLFISGRIKEIINRGGEKISPREIDDVLLSHSAVAQVLSFGVSHPSLGENIAVAVVLEEGKFVTQRELRMFLSEHLAAFKIPQRFYFVSELPKGSTGKLDRRQAAKMFADTLTSPTEMPQSSTERFLAEIWGDALSVDCVGRNDNFFSLGGDSLSVTRILLQIEEHFKQKLPLSILSVAPTIRELEEVLEQSPNEGSRGICYQIERSRGDDLSSILEVLGLWNLNDIPSVEMPDLDLSCVFVARDRGKVVGAAGYKILSKTEGKTTVMAVRPEYLGSEIGRLLQEARLHEMAEQGIKRVITNADRPAAIKWYEELFGYKKIGCIKKKHSFGDPDVDTWTTLELDLEAYSRRSLGLSAESNNLERE